MLISFTGLPGSGKTTLARRLVRVTRAVHLRIDTIEQAMQRTGLVAAAGGWYAFPAAGYQVGYAIVEEQLREGQLVIADSVNPIEVTRQAWRDVAARCDVRVLEVEIACTDEAEHRRRVETREADIPDHTQPTWQDVLDREYEPLVVGPDALSLDTSEGFDQSVRDVLAGLD